MRARICGIVPVDEAHGAAMHDLRDFFAEKDFALGFHVPDEKFHHAVNLIRFVPTAVASSIRGEPRMVLRARIGRPSCWQ